MILGIYDPDNADKDLDIHFDKGIKKDENNIYSILEDEPVDSKYYISEYEEKVLAAWNEFYRGINRDVLGFPVWADYFVKEADEMMPDWKKTFIRKNHELYNENKMFIDAWLYKYDNLKEFTPTHRKFEWQAGKSIKSIWEGIIQFRPSGVRVKKPTCFPALVAIVQIPIIGERKRRLTVREAARLQSFQIVLFLMIMISRHINSSEML